MAAILTMTFGDRLTYERAGTFDHRRMSDMSQRLRSHAEPDGAKIAKGFLLPFILSKSHARVG